MMEHSIIKEERKEHIKWREREKDMYKSKEIYQKMLIGTKALFIADQCQ